MTLEHVGPYRIVRPLGEGGMGVVYEAFHEAIARRVAIKVLKPDYARSPAVMARFFNGMSGEILRRKMATSRRLE